MVKYSWIVAVSQNGVIGKEGKLPWKLLDDMKIFREATTGKTVLMGRKTYEDIGKPLPNRTNLVLTRDESRTIVGCKVFSSLEKVVKQLQIEETNLSAKEEEEVMIIGGEAVYRETSDLVTRVYLTRVLAEVQGDTFFQQEFLEREEWHPVGEPRRFEQSERNQFAFEHVIYERICHVQDNKQ